MQIAIIENIEKAKPRRAVAKRTTKLSKKTCDLLALPADRRDRALAALVDHARGEKPAGSYDNASRWYPDQRCFCCTYIRSPSRAWPFSFLKHSLSLEHKEQLHKANHADVLIVRRWFNENEVSLRNEAEAKKAMEKALRKAIKAAAALDEQPTAPARAEPVLN